jgi:hypothetical protein
VRNVFSRVTIAAAAAVTAGLIGLASPAAATDDPYPPKGGWPTPTCGGKWHPCTTSPPATTRPPRHTTPPPPVKTTPPAPPVTTQPPPPPPPVETTTPPATTVTRTVTETTSTAPPPPVWTEPQLPVTGARPGVVGWSVGGGLALIGLGYGVLWFLRRRRAAADGVA